MISQPDLSIIIVNWNSVEFLRRCLASIFAAECRFTFEVLVLDNGSRDGCAEMLRRHFPQVHFLQSHQNLGFAAANNLAFAFSSGSNLLFLNPDTEVLQSGLQRLFNALLGAPHAGIVGPRLVDPALATQWNCMRCFPTILNQALDSSLSRHLFPAFWGLDVTGRRSLQPVPAEVVPATCLMVRREVFAAAGRFCENYFMYAEDVDLCFRTRNLGWKTYYVDDAVVIHHGGQSSRQRRESAFSTVLMRESVWKFLLATRGPAYAAIYRATTALAALCRIPLCAALGSFAGGQRRPQWRVAGKKWMCVLRWSLGLERWVRSLPAPRPRRAPPLSVAPAAAGEGRLRA